MKILNCALLVCLLTVSQIGFAASNSRITLNDGTTIFGKVVGMSDGFYVIDTENLGQIKVNSDNVMEINSNVSSNSRSNSKNIGILDGNAKKTNTRSLNSGYGTGNYSEQQKNVNTKIQSMMMNEDFMENMMQLGQSSAMQSVLNDPEIMDAIQNCDYDFLMNNSKMESLMNSSEIQDILGDM